MSAPYARRVRSVAVSLSFVGVVFIGAQPAFAQLFENLEALGTRLDSGDPDTFAFREGPKGIATGDLDGDGSPDLVTSNLDGTVTYWKGRGDGTFEKPEHLQTKAKTLRDVILAEITGDEYFDIIAAAPFDDLLFLFEGSDGGPSPEAIALPAWHGARDLGAADLDGDGLDELIAGGPNVGLRVYRRNANGEIAPAEAIATLAPAIDRFPKPVFSISRWRAPADDRDRVIVTHALSDRTWILRQAPMGQLAVESEVVTTRLGSVVPEGSGADCFLDDRCVYGVYSIDVGALTRPSDSGIADLVTAHRNLGVVQVWRGTESGTSFARDVAQEIAIPGGPRSVEIADLDGDGWNDLLVVVRNLDLILTYRNHDGRLEAASEMPVGRSPRELAVADFDNDGELDAAVINRISADVSVLRGHPDRAGFSILDSVYVVDGEVSGLSLVDMNGDGRDDVVQLHLASGDASVRFASEGGLLGPPMFLPMGSIPSAQEVVDVNGDGYPDIVVANLGARRGSVSVRLGDGNGRFGELRTYELPVETEGRLFALEAADFDGDSDIDLAAGFLDCRIAFFRNDGEGSFAMTHEHQFVYEARAMASGDFDGDGDIDLAGAGFAGDVVVIENRLENGEGLLDTTSLTRKDYPRPSAEKFGASAIDVADLNHDGDLDLVVGSGHGGMLFLGAEGSNFVRGEETLPGTAFPASSVAVADFDGDGSREIAVACRILSCITVLTPTARGEYTPALTADVPSGRLLAAGDLDGDGQADLVGSGDVLWTALSSRRAKRSEPPSFSSPRQVISHPVINEVLAVNRSFPLAQSGGTTSDFVEIFHGGEESVSLRGWKLVLSALERPEEISAWSFPGDARLEPGEHRIIVFANTLRDAWHTGRRLPGEGGTLVLVDDQGTGVDFVSYPAQEADVSYARFHDGALSFVASPYPSAGATNLENGPVAPHVRLVAVEPANLGGDSLRPFRPGEPMRFIAEGSDDIGIVSLSVLWRPTGTPESAEQRLVLHDDGLHDDGKSQDGRFAGILPGLQDGAEIVFRLEATDLSDQTTYEPESDADDDNDSEKGSSPYAVAVVSRAPSIEISELVSRNQNGLRDEWGGTPDWVEIQNCGAEPIALDALFLAESYPQVDLGERYVFPAGVVLDPGSAFIVFGDSNSSQGPRHAPFRLDADGGRLVLGTRTAGGASLLIDAVDYPELSAGISWARTACGGPWRSATPTPEHYLGKTVARGDVDGNGSRNITDAISLASELFLGGQTPCPAAGDANADGERNVTDVVFLLLWLFQGGTEPPEAHFDCEAAPR